MAMKQRRHKRKDPKADHKGATPAPPAGAKGYNKISLPELPIIDVNIGHNISNIRDAIVQYWQRELGPTSGIFTDLKYKEPAEATFDERR